uniref:Uncharacterized protein n=1 Tax=Noccaea caerulescens TaxID=107243 RepID=A0A1J3DM68_NOCCA
MNLNLVPNGNKVRLILEIISSDSLSQNDRETKLISLGKKENQAKTKHKATRFRDPAQYQCNSTQPIESQKKQDH